MSTSKSKNIIIIALVLLNVFLVAILLVDRAEARSAMEAEIEALEGVMKQRGISLGDDIDFSVGAPLPCTILRSEKNDDKLIDNLIDYNYREDMGGNVIFYSSDIGQAILRGTGEISLIFNDELPDMSSDHAAAAAKYMEKNGLKLFSNLAKVNASNDGATAILPCEFDGYCIYNSKLSFTVSGEKLMMIDGTRPFDGETSYLDEAVIDSVSAMMCFMEIVRSDGYICSRVNGIEAGYFMNVAVSGECTLRPVWKVATDTGDIYINAVSGKMESLPA